jgi:hypothetical protein
MMQISPIINILKRVQFLTKENKLIMPVQVAEEWIKGSHPKENVIHDRLELLLANLRNYS